MNTNTTEFSEIYAIHNTEIAPEVHELAVSHVDWNDMQATHDEPATIVLTPSAVFIPTNHGLSIIMREEDLWDCIPKIVDNTLEDDKPHFADNDAAQEVFNYLLSCIAAECPNFQFVKRRDTTKKRR